MTAPNAPGPATDEFDPGFVDDLDRLLRWRRDVRRFRTDPLDQSVLDAILTSAELSPSVGNSQPWRWVEVNSHSARSAIRDNFETCNADALRGLTGQRARLYAGLKLAGLAEAPVQLAVFTDGDGAQGYGLGRATMPETLHYSTVAAITTLWLAARARGIGVGWVSILNAAEVCRTLEVPASWQLTAYLCLGHPCRSDEVPELQRVGWQDRTDPAARRFTR